MSPSGSWLLDSHFDWLPSCLYSQTDRDDAGELRPVQPPPPASAQEKSSLLVVDPHRINLHLSYSPGLEHGPIILRRGDESPIMEDPEKPGSYTTDPDIQRIGAYYIREKQKVDHLRVIAYWFAGNYILHGEIEGRDTARHDARRVFLTYFPHQLDIDFPFPPEFADTFPHDLVEFLTGSGVLDLLGVPAPLSSKWKKGTASYKEASIKMNELYSERGLISKFETLSKSAQFRRSVLYNLNKYLRLLILLSKTPSHDQEISSRAEGDVVLIQGCGDLTMNEWNVAFVSGDSLPRGERRDWNLLHAPGEPLNDREYTCLIKWQCERNHPDLLKIVRTGVRIVYPYQIASLQFLAPSLGSVLPDRHVFLRGEPIGHLIEFAVYGRRVLRSGKVANLANIVREFSDVRHIFTLPNLNRGGDYLSHVAEKNIPEYGQKPRNLFNRSTQDDVWLGEAPLLQGERNLRVAALGHAVQLNVRDLGAPKEWIETVLQKDGSIYGYEYRPLGTEIDGPGQWRWIPEGRRMWLEIFFLRSQYPCSMIGVKAEDEDADRGQMQGLVNTEKLYFLAHGHVYNQGSCTIRQAARHLRNQGAWDGLLFDEGMDVFQLVYNPRKRRLEEAIPLMRKQLRCVFWGVESSI